MHDGRVRPAYLGLVSTPARLTPIQAERYGQRGALRVVEAVEKSPAAQSGLLGGDLVLAIDGARLAMLSRCRSACMPTRSGSGWKSPLCATARWWTLWFCRANFQTEGGHQVSESCLPAPRGRAARRPCCRPRMFEGGSSGTPARARLAAPRPWPQPRAPATLLDQLGQRWASRHRASADRSKAASFRRFSALGGLRTNALFYRRPTVNATVSTWCTSIPADLRTTSFNGRR